MTGIIWERVTESQKKRITVTESQSEKARSQKANF
jgi:hypothetical protein